MTRCWSTLTRASPNSRLQTLNLNSRSSWRRMYFWLWGQSGSFTKKDFSTFIILRTKKTPTFSSTLKVHSWWIKWIRSISIDFPWVGCHTVRTGEPGLWYWSLCSWCRGLLSVRSSLWSRHRWNYLIRLVRNNSESQFRGVSRRLQKHWRPPGMWLRRPGRVWRSRSWSEQLIQR